MNLNPSAQLSLPLPTPLVSLAGLPSPASSRRLFWGAFLDWLAVATIDETEQLERALAAHAHHVRPLVDAVSDALIDRHSARLLPPTLLAQLVATGWQPAPTQLVRRAA